MRTSRRSPRRRLARPLLALGTITALAGSACQSGAGTPDAYQPYVPPCNAGFCGDLSPADLPEPSDGQPGDAGVDADDGSSR